MLNRQALRKLQHLVHAAPRLDGACHRQAVVSLDEQTPLALSHAEHGLQSGRMQQRRLHLACGLRQFGEHLRQQSGKTGQSGCGCFRIIQTNGSP